jgi:hypothetical protein
MCIGLLEKQQFLWKTELRKLTNSQPGVKFLTFPKSIDSSPGFIVAIRSCLRNFLRDENLLSQQILNVHYIIKF